MSDFICQKYTDCSSCSHYQKQIFKYRSFPKGMMIPKERCSQNTIYFLISGSVRVTSDEHPGTVFHDGQFIMQPIGSRVEFHILESTECILYLFETPQNICTDVSTKDWNWRKSLPCSLSSWICVSLCAFLSTGSKCTSTTNSCVWNS